MNVTVWIIASLLAAVFVAVGCQQWTTDDPTGAAIDCSQMTDWMRGRREHTETAFGTPLRRVQ
jgi:hypothetical protein